VIGIVQVGSQAMADRYMYIPLIGLSFAVTWAACSFLGRDRAAKQTPRRETAKLSLVAVVLAIVIALTWAARVQAGYWRDSVSLFTHAVEATPGNARAEALLAGALEARGDLQGAAKHYFESVRIRPNIASRQSSLGLLLLEIGRPEEGLVSLQRRGAVRAQQRRIPKHPGHRV
jgi:Flp pilus assembly protein TadD